jgi:hypothetical protein
VPEHIEISEADFDRGEEMEGIPSAVIITTTLHTVILQWNADDYTSTSSVAFAVSLIH